MKDNLKKELKDIEKQIKILLAKKVKLEKAIQKTNEVKVVKKVVVKKPVVIKDVSKSKPKKKRK